MTPEQLQHAYLEVLRRKGRSQSTRELNGRWLRGYFEYCAGQGVQALEQLTPAHLHGYHQSLLWRSSHLGRRYSPHSLYQMMQMLRAFLRWALLHGHLERDLAAGLVLPRPPQLPPPLLPLPDLQRLREQLDLSTPRGLRDRALLEVFYVAGLTKHQAHRLDLADVQLRARQLVVRRPPRPRQQVILSDDLAEALSRYLWEGRPQLHPRTGELAVFISQSGLRMGGTAISARLELMAKRAGLGQAVTPRLLNRSGRAHRDAGKTRGGPGEH